MIPKWWSWQSNRENGSSCTYCQLLKKECFNTKMHHFRLSREKRVTGKLNDMDKTEWLATPKHHVCHSGSFNSLADTSVAAWRDQTAIRKNILANVASKPKTLRKVLKADSLYTGKLMKLMGKLRPTLVYFCYLYQLVYTNQLSHISTVFPSANVIVFHVSFHHSCSLCVWSSQK